MMKYRICVNCPDKEDLINNILDAMSQAGAGNVGAYSRVALVVRGYETWKSEEGAHPNIGEVGKISDEPSVQIQMEVSQETLESVVMAIRQSHPYEEPVIQLIRLEEHPSLATQTSRTQ